VALSWQSIHLAAYREATRVHRELSLDLTHAIDPFAALAALGVVVIRRPLSGAAGLYLPSEPPDRQSAGVLVNVLHPVSKQRYTAAHELGHHRRDRQAIIDSDTEWLARGEDQQSDRERLAEAFAAWFLMPKPLVLSVLDRMDVRPNQLTPGGAYRLALELGTSYQATVNHLGDLRIIASSQRRGLLQASPRSVKEALGARTAAPDLRRDVWQIDPARDAAPVRAAAGDLLVVDLEETPSSGYLWSVTVPTGVSLVSDEWMANNSAPLGGEGTHRFWLSLDRPGVSVVRLEKRRPWRAEATGRSEVAVEAVDRPAVGIVEPEQLVAASA
jgi:predicted secreted protein